MNYLSIFLLYLIKTSVSIYPVRLRFSSDNRMFGIVQITDTYFGESMRNDAMTLKMIKNLIKMIQPSLIVFTGNFINGRFKEYQEKWENISNFLSDLKQPYYLIPGKSDLLSGMSFEGIVEMDKLSDFSISREKYSSLYPKEDRIKTNNSFKRVYSSQQKDKVSLIIWFIDSSNIDISQIIWYEKNVYYLQMELGYLPESYIFLNYPLPEYVNAYNLSKTNGLKLSQISCFQNKLFDYLIKVKAIFTGGDTDNDFCGAYINTNLCYGRRTGVSSKISILDPGIRVIEIYEEEDQINSSNTNYETDFYSYIINSKGDINEPNSYFYSHKGFVNYVKNCN